MLLPPVLSILLTSTLSSSSSYSSLPSPSPTPRTIRIGASSLVSHLLKLHAASYPSLPPRITKTFLVALLDDGTVINALSPDGTSNRKAAALGTKDGAIRGLIGVGREAVLRGIIGGRIGKSLGLDVEKKIRISRGMMEDVDEAMMDLSNLGGPAGREGWTEEVKDVVDSFTVRSTRLSLLTLTRVTAGRSRSHPPSANFHSKRYLWSWRKPSVTR